MRLVGGTVGAAFGLRTGAPRAARLWKKFLDQSFCTTLAADDRAEAVGPNHVWAMDFLHDQLATSKKLRVLTVVDTFSRYVPVLDARFSNRGEDVDTTLHLKHPAVNLRHTRQL